MLYGNFISRTDPWRELDRIHREVDRLFHGISPVRRRQFPPINVWVNSDEVIITAELPGFALEDIHLSIVGNELTMKGSREVPKLKEGEVYHRHERVHGKFERTIQLPFVVDYKKIEARLSDGVLKITLPRAESDRPVKIEIKSN